jgi:hypothetical protein
MSGSVQFPAEAVLQHAAAVSDTSAQMSQAQSAVREVTMDSQAYGQLCHFLPSLLSPLFGTAVEVMAETVETLDETALKLRSTASSMEVTDAGTARRVSDAAGAGLVLPL